MEESPRGRDNWSRGRRTRVTYELELTGGSDDSGSDRENEKRTKGKGFY